jgi:hypothetical protein
MASVVSLSTLIANVVIAGSLYVATAQAQAPSPSGSPSPPPASDEDTARCVCWYTGFDDFQSGKTCTSIPPLSAADCELLGGGIKAQWKDGCVGAKDGAGRKCPYKK